MGGAAATLAIAGPLVVAHEHGLIGIEGVGRRSEDGRGPHLVGGAVAPLDDRVHLPGEPWHEQRPQFLESEHVVVLTADAGFAGRPLRIVDRRARYRRWAFRPVVWMACSAQNSSPTRRWLKPYGSLSTGVPTTPITLDFRLSERSDARSNDLSTVA